MHTWIIQDIYSGNKLFEEAVDNLRLQSPGFHVQIRSNDAAASIYVRAGNPSCGSSFDSYNSLILDFLTNCCTVLWLTVRETV